MEAEPLFWSIAEDLMSSRVEEGKIMSSRCIRSDGNFAAMVGGESWGLVVKLNTERVKELIAEGSGAPFAPAGKVFKEWVSIRKQDEREWRTLIQEAIATNACEQ